MPFCGIIPSGGGHMPRTYYTESQNKATQKYHKAHYDQLSVRIPKGKREVYVEYARSKGMSIASLIMSLIEEDMKKPR